MDRGARVFWASLVVVVGIMIASVFRHSTGSAPTWSTPSEADRSGAPTYQVRRLPPVDRVSSAATGQATPPSGSGPGFAPPVGLALSSPGVPPAGLSPRNTAPPPQLADRYPAPPLPSYGWVPALGPRRLGSANSAEVVHRVKDGDTLPQLAARYLGDPHRFMEIFEANRHVLASPDLLPIGVELIIPRRVSAEPGSPQSLGAPLGASSGSEVGTPVPPRPTDQAAARARTALARASI